MFKWLSPVHYIRKIRGVRSDIKGKEIFVKYLPQLYNDKYLTRYRKTLQKESMYLGVDLIPEIKLQHTDKYKLEIEEKRRLAVEVSKLNDVFAKHGLFEFVKLIPEKVDNDDHYGFMVEIIYRYTNLTKKSVSYIIFYSLFLLGILGIGAYLLWSNFL